VTVNDHRSDRDVAAPRSALAWAAGIDTVPGRWLHDEDSVTRAASDGETVWRTEIDPRTGRTWVRNVRGHAPLADVMHLATDLDHLRTVLIEMAEQTADALASPAT
jgi:hypothetical protein